MDDEYHSTVQEVHTSFMEAGSQAVTTNSYGISPGVGFTDPVERHDLVATSGRLARESVTHFIASKKSQQDEPQQDDQSDCFVLGSLGPLSESYRADLILPHDQAIQDYQVAIKALRPNVDAIIAETMSCVTESIQVLDSLATLVQQDSSFTELPLLVSYTLDSSGKFRDGQSVCEGLHEVLAAAGKKQLHGTWDEFYCGYLSFEWGLSFLCVSLTCLLFTFCFVVLVAVLAILFNCSEPEAITTALCQIAQDSALVKLLEARSIRLGAYANRLTAVDPNWTMESSGAPQPFRSDLDEAHYWKDFVQPWIQDLNVQLVGGCCGITPEHIAYIRYELQSH